MNLLERLRDIVALPERESDPENMPLAMAVLLVEVARADYVDNDQEQTMLLKLLSELCGLSESESGALIAMAEQTAEQDVSLHRHLAVLNRSLDPAEKFRIMRAMWEVALADNELHSYEEHLLRRLADLLHVSHSDFIRARHQVTGEA